MSAIDANQAIDAIDAIGAIGSPPPGGAGIAKRSCWRAALVLAVAVTGAADAEPWLRVELPPAPPRVGDPVVATVVLTLPPAELAAEPRFPAWQKTWGEVEILAAGPVVRARTANAIDAIEFRQAITLAAFAPGSIDLPAQQVVVPGPGGSVTLTTPAGLQLRVRSVLPAPATDAPKPEPKPPLPPRPLPVGEVFWWSLAIGLGLCLAAGFALWRRARRATVASTEIAALSPLAELRAALAHLGESGVEAAHTRLSFALRRYLGRAMGFPAVESTTSEIGRELRHRRAPSSVVAQTAQVLRDCDGVKFAREGATAAVLEARIVKAGAVAAEIEAHVSPPVAVVDRAAGLTGATS